MPRLPILHITFAHHMQQSKALEILKSGRNVFLTGSAGTGKTHVLNQYIRYLRDNQVHVAITASTGIAATHMKGTTIHSWSGIGIRQILSEKNLQVMKTKQHLKKNINKARVLIIDEISMLHKTQLDLVDRVLQFFKENAEPFGGIQVVVCGDFFQLPPIGDSRELSRDKFAFMSHAWVNAEFNVCYLTEQYRQTDQGLNQILQEIRKGQVSEYSFRLLQKAQHTTLDDEFTRLYTHNMDVDQINQRHLEELSGKKRTFKCTETGTKSLSENLRKSVLCPEKLDLKIGARVMFVKNNPEKQFVNGTLGIVNGFNEIGLPKVKVTDGRIISVSPEKWSIDDERGKSVASYTQIPLRLAWAITIHKSQGMTLDAAEIDP